MGQASEKVTAFITRQTKDGDQLLLLEHPHAGIQIPAGTVEPTETPQNAVLREAAEETGLTFTSQAVYLGCQETQLPPDEAVILPPATVYTRPDSLSFDWIRIRSAVQVKVLRKSAGFTQITYLEHDQEPAPNYVSMQITGWVQDEFLAQMRKRYFFYLEFEGATEPRWKVFSDHHTFTLFWSSLGTLPGIIPPQDSWLAYLEKFMEAEKIKRASI